MSLAVQELTTNALADYGTRRWRAGFRRRHDGHHAERDLGAVSVRLSEVFPGRGPTPSGHSALTKRTVGAIGLAQIDFGSASIVPGADIADCIDVPSFLDVNIKSTSHRR